MILNVSNHKVSSYLTVKSGHYKVMLNSYENEMDIKNKTGYTFYIHDSKVLLSEDKYSFNSSFKSFDKSMIRAIHVGNRTDELNMYRAITNCYHCFPDLFINNVDDYISYI